MDTLQISLQCECQRASKTTGFSSDTQVEVRLKGGSQRRTHERCLYGQCRATCPGDSYWGWAGGLRDVPPGWYSLVGAAALVAFGLFDFGDAPGAPKFTVLSFYKMFGVSNLGVLIIQNDAPACSGRSVTLPVKQSVFRSLSLNQWPNENCFTVYPPTGRGSEYASLSVNYSGIYCEWN